MISSSTAARERGGSVYLLIGGVLWGTGGLAGSILAAKADLHPLSVAAYRLLLGGGFTVLFLQCTGGLRALPRTAAVVRRVLSAGVLLALFQACYFSAVTLTSVSIATMTTIGSVPVFVAVGSAVVDRRRPNASTWVSIAGALAGLALLTWSPEGMDDAGGGARLIVGLACALGSGAGFATLTLVTRRPVEGLDAVRTTAFGCLTGGVLLLGPALVLGAELPLRVDVLAVAVYLGVVPTGLGYIAYFHGLRTAGPIMAALAALLEPLTAALLATLLLGDRLGVLGWCGAGLLVGAIAVGAVSHSRVRVA